MREVYVCAGLYAEGRTDYYFLRPLLDRLLDELLATLYTARYTLVPTEGIDAPEPRPRERAACIAAAVQDRLWNPCNLFIIHSDGDADPAARRQSLIEPGMAAVRTLHDTCPLAACIPVRETEAWLLADPRPFAVRLGPGRHPLPADPERVTDPKAALMDIFQAAKSPFASRQDYAFFGENVQLAALRRLTAFVAFERELLAALRLLDDP